MIPIRRPSLATAKGMSRPFTILSIEDDPAVSRMCERRLAACGADVQCAGNGADGYALALAATPDLILLDNTLPDEEGVDFLDRLRSNTATADIPVMMLTGSDTAALQRRVITQGVVRVFEKPVNFDQLIEEIVRLAPSE